MVSLSGMCKKQSPMLPQEKTLKKASEGSDPIFLRVMATQDTEWLLSPAYPLFINPSVLAASEKLQQIQPISTMCQGRPGTRFCPTERSKEQTLGIGNESFKIR